MLNTANTKDLSTIEIIPHVSPETWEERKARQDAEYDHTCRMRSKYSEYNVTDDEDSEDQLRTHGGNI